MLRIQVERKMEPQLMDQQDLVIKSVENWSDNPSGLVPTGHACLVETYEPELRTSVIQLPSDVASRLNMVEQRCILIAVGHEAWKDEGPWWKRLLGIRTPRAALGDKVLVTKFAGYVTTQTADGKLYRLVNDRDIFCKIAWK